MIATGMRKTKRLQKKEMSEMIYVADISDKIRDGETINDPNTGAMYRGLFVHGNFLLYRYVEAGRGYRGQTYETAGYVLAWADLLGELIVPPPTWVPLRGAR